jgi:hypothetical protein
MHNPCFFFSSKRPKLNRRYMGPLKLQAELEPKNIEIRLVHFTTGKQHKSADKAVVQLDSLEWYDTEFKAHIAIMGGYLVVLVAYISSKGKRNRKRIRRYQIIYLVDWKKGDIIHVRTPSTTFESLIEFLIFSCRNGRLLKTHTSLS